MPSSNAVALANARLVKVTGTPESDWDCCFDSVCGMGEEFFFTHKTNEFRFIYMCIEDGVITSVEGN